MNLKHNIATTLRRYLAPVHADKAAQEIAVGLAPAIKEQMLTVLQGLGENGKATTTAAARRTGASTATGATPTKRNRKPQAAAGRPGRKPVGRQLSAKEKMSNAAKVRWAKVRISRGEAQPGDEQLVAQAEKNGHGLAATPAVPKHAKKTPARKAQRKARSRNKQSTRAQAQTQASTAAVPFQGETSEPRNGVAGASTTDPTMHAPL